MLAFRWRSGAKLGLALAMAAAQPVAAQTPDFSGFEAAAEAAGWRVGLLPLPESTPPEASNLRLQRGAVVLLAERLQLDETAGPEAFRLDGVRLLELGREGRSGEMTARTLAASHTAALDLLDPRGAPDQDFCAEDRPATLRLRGSDVVMLADPDAMSLGQAGPEALRVGQAELSILRQGTGETCGLALSSTLEQVQARAADGTEGYISALRIEADTGPENGALTHLALEIVDLGARNGNRLLMAAERLALRASGADLARLIPGNAGNAPLLARLFDAEGEVALEIDAIDLPLGDLLPEDIALPAHLLARIPGERVAGDFTMMARLGEQGAVALGLDMTLSGLADLDFDIEAIVPQSAGGAEMLPGVPAEIAGISLKRAGLALHDRGLDALLDHYTGRGLQTHTAEALRPAGRVLPGPVLAGLQAGVEDWLARALRDGAWLELAPQEPVSLMQVGSLMLFAPDGVVELLGLRTER
ncbi:hypothetical protein [Alkalilacustris brevis]|uniref:hypothetical protein n=1 Tax=Alkalilacustris brevis TaxID=2026338 RepID=UPI000E0DA77C|nr:hypothetical protein [Alkalilacustris brevis]